MVSAGENQKSGATSEYVSLSRRWLFPSEPVSVGALHGRRGVNNTYVSRRATLPILKPMVRKKTLSPSGAKDENGEYHNVHVNLHEDELAVAGLEIGDEVFVRVRDGKIIIQKADPDEVEHDF